MTMSILRKLFAMLLLSIASLTWAVDINVATSTELQSVKGIGPKTAEKIIHERTESGNFVSWEDIWRRVRGIGPKSIIRLADNGLTLDGTTYATP